MTKKAPKPVFFLAAALFCFFAVFLLYPLAHILKKGIMPSGRLTFTFLGSLFVNPVIRQSLLRSLLLAFFTTFFCLVLSLPLALFSARRQFRGQSILSGLLLIPLVLPPFVGAIGMKQLLGRFGTLNLLFMDSSILSSPVDFLGQARFWGVVILQVLHLFPIMYLNLAASLASVDPSLEEAARNMGASSFGTFRRVTVPMVLPGIFAGGIIVFIWALTDLGTPLIFEYREVLSVQIFDRVTDMEDNPEGYALVLMVLLLTAAGFLLARATFARKRTGSAGKTTAAAARPKLEGPGLIAAYVLFGAVILISLLPHAAVFLTSLRKEWFMTAFPTELTTSHYSAALAHTMTINSIRNSLILSAGATLIDVLLGVAIAYVLARSRLRSMALLDTVVMLPLALPGIVVAFGYMGAFGDTFLDARKDPTILLMIAYSVRRLPYVVRSAYAGFVQVDSHLEEAASNLGATPFRTLWRITLPMVAASLMAGAILAFAFAMLEVSDSLILALKEPSYPITKAIYMMLGRIDDGPEIACALGVWAMAFLAASLLWAHRVLGKRMGEIFRA